MAKSLQRIAFGGGCHWCTEAVFQTLNGVSKTEQGFVKSIPPNDNWSEAVIVHFDPLKMPMAVLLEIHLRTHASTSQHSMRGKYRSAVYTFSSEQTAFAQREMIQLQSGFNAPLVTKVLPFKDFKTSDIRFHNYYQTDPKRPFCQNYIDPKLAKLRKEFSSYLT